MNTHSYRFFRQPLTLSLNVPLEQTVGWRGKHIDPTGNYYLGGRSEYDPVAGRFTSADPLGHSASMDLYSFCGGDPVNHYDPDGRQFFVPSPAFAGPQYIDNEFFRQGTYRGQRLAAAAGVGSVAAISGGELALPVFNYFGASTTVTTFGAGAVGGFSGNAASQTFELLTGDRTSFSGYQLATSTAAGGVLAYGVNLIAAPRLLLNQMGNREIGILGEQQAVQDIVQNGGTIAGQQVKFQTPDGNPTADLVVPDASSPSGFRVIEVKTGEAALTQAQSGGYPQIATGNAVPNGSSAEQAGLPVGEALPPTPVDIWRYQPYQLLPFNPVSGGFIGAGFTMGANSFSQQSGTGGCGKHAQ